MVILAALPGMVRELLVTGNLVKPGNFSVSVNFLGYRIRKVGLGGPRRTGKPPITSVVLTLRGPKHHEPARRPCPQSSGTCRQGLAGSHGPRARREQPVVSLARSGAEAQTGQRDIDPARVAESCSQRSHRGRCADAPSWRADWQGPSWL